MSTTGTQFVEPYPVQGLVSNTELVLVDAPGFDDPDNKDYDILNMIVNYSEKKNSPPVAGVIYFHRITDTRFSAAERLNLEVVKAICGEEFYPHIVLCTSMWDTLPNDARGHYQVVAHHARLMTLLRSSHPSSPAPFQDLLDGGATYMEFWGQRRQDPCMEILRHFTSLRDPPKLAVQEQAPGIQDIRDTTAGTVIEQEHRKRAKTRKRKVHHSGEKRGFNIWGFRGGFSI